MSFTVASESTEYTLAVVTTEFSTETILIVFTVVGTDGDSLVTAVGAVAVAIADSILADAFAAGTRELAHLAGEGVLLFVLVDVVVVGRFSILIVQGEAWVPAEEIIFSKVFFFFATSMIYEEIHK